MAIRFKFRSSATFDTVAIGGRPSISLRDLKSEIALCKNLDACGGFDLLLSDAISGREYRDGDCQIPSGSSLIIKRVPAGTAHMDVTHISLHEGAEKEGGNMRKSTSVTNVAIENFDDFGEELCPMLEAAISGSSFDGDGKIEIDNGKMDAEFPRCSEKPSLGCTESLLHDLQKANPGGLMPVVDERQFEVKPKPFVERHAMLDNVATSIPEVLQNSYLPAELKCSLCGTFFKEAVMIPCCQHSFCEKCIHRVLIQNGRCPKCFSPKPRVEDLLPNVSLRLAIDHFLSSQVTLQGSDNALDQYAPDGESGIHAKGTSYGVTIHQRQESPSYTDRGSNQLIDEPGDGRMAYMSQNQKVTHGPIHGSTHPVNFKGRNEAEFQGESQPTHEEAESRSTRKRMLQVKNAGGERSFAGTDWYKKGVRACYTCGSLDHLMRDCPDALSSLPRFQTGAMPGYPSPFWNGISFPHFRNFGSLYANAGFNPYLAAMLPPTGFTVPNHAPAMFGLMPGYSMGGTPVVPVVGPQWDQGCLQFREPQGRDKRQKISFDDSRRERSPYVAEDRALDDRRRYGQSKKANRCKLDRDRECFSDDSQRSLKQRQRHSHIDDDTERSGSEVENIPPTSKFHDEKRLISRRVYDEKRNHQREQDRSDSGKHDEKRNHQREHRGSDSGHSKSRRICSKVKDVERKCVHSDSRREWRKHHSHSDSVLEPSYKENDSNHGSGHSRRNARSLNNELGHERWQMVSGGSGDNGNEDHVYYNRFGNS